MPHPIEILIAATPYLPRWVVEAARAAADLDTPRTLEAAVLVCDLVGFTATTRELTERGAAGPEETLEHLNAWYRRVLEPVLQEDGDIVAFAGDSFTAIFEGATADTRLARAARAARGILASGSAAARLGVAEGPVTLGVVGSDDARHPVILGPTARRAALAMQAAEASSLHRAAGDEVSDVDPHTLLSPVDAGPADDESTLNSSADLLGRPRETLQRLRPFLPASVWEGLLHTRSAGEHRTAVILFARVGRAEGPALAFAEVRATLSRAAQLIERVGGHVQKIDTGDKGLVLLAFFGIPRVTPAAPARAAEAAIGLAEALGLAVAVSSGRVFAGDLGGPSRHEFSAVGAPINRCARILQATPPGEVHSDADFATELETLNSTALPDLHAKGFDHPIPVRRLGREHSGKFAAFIEERSPLLGRDTELATILAYGRGDPQALGPQMTPGALIVSGALGIGKSRIIREAARLLQEGPVLTAFGHFGTYRAYRTLSEVAEGLGVAVADDRTGLLDGLSRAFSAEAKRVVLFLEDLHLAREDDLAAWRKLLPLLLSSGGALIATTRPDISLPDFGERLDLQHLDPAAALALVRHHAPTLSIGEAELISRQGAGNPLFLEQLAMRAFSGDGVVPDTVEDAIRERLEHLDPLARQVLDTASIAPPLFDFSAFDALVTEEGPVPVREAVTRLLEARVLRSIPGGAYRFAHDMERAVVHDSLSFAARRTLHRRALDLLEAHGEVGSAEAIEHLEALGEREAAGRAALAAARAFMGVRAEYEVLRLARLALERLVDPVERCEAEAFIARGLAYVADWRGSNALAERVEHEAARLKREDLRIWMALTQAENWSLLANYEASEQALRRMGEGGEMGGEFRARFSMVQGWNAWGRGLYPEARSHLEAALRSVDADLPVHDAILSGLITVLIHLGAFRAARTLIPAQEEQVGFRWFCFLFDHIDLIARRADLSTLHPLLAHSEKLHRNDPTGSRVVHELEARRAVVREQEGRWDEAATARDFAIATNVEIESHYDALQLLVVNTTEALLSGELEGLKARTHALGLVAEALEAGDESARLHVLGALAELFSGNIKRDLADLVYRNRRFAERSRRWDLILAVETLAALLNKDLDAQGRALATLIDRCREQDDRLGERFVRLLGWRGAQRAGQTLEAQRRWLAFTDQLDAWGCPRWTFGTKLGKLPDGLPGLSPASPG